LLRHYFFQTNEGDVVVASKQFFIYVVLTDVDITDRAIQVGGARKGQSFVLKV
jgi:hypothetical protein